MEEIWSEIMEKSPNTWLPSSFLQNQPKSGKIQQQIKDQIQTGDSRKKKKHGETVEARETPCQSGKKMGHLVRRCVSPPIEKTQRKLLAEKHPKVPGHHKQ